MKISRRSIIGVTLLEVILVLVVGSSLILLGYKYYLSMKLDSDVAQVKYNVEVVFAAAAAYYQANCRQQLNPVTGAQVGTYGTLDPRSNPAANVPVSITTLQSTGFLTTPLPKDVLIDSSAPGGGYTVQFNRVPNQARIVNGVQDGEIIVWNMQVAVAIKYKNPLAIIAVLGANCNSVLSGTIVTPCTGTVSGAGNNYAVWYRLPSYAAPDAASGYMLTNMRMMQYNQTQTNSAYSSSIVVPSDPSSTYQNYLCNE